MKFAEAGQCFQKLVKDLQIGRKKNCKSLVSILNETNQIPTSQQMSPNKQRLAFRKKNFKSRVLSQGVH